MEYTVLPLIYKLGTFKNLGLVDVFVTNLTVKDE